MLTGYQFVWWQLTLFIAVVLYLGLFMAIPLKKQMIQVEELRFPANIPTGETLTVMYAHAGQAMKKATALGIAAVSGVVVAGCRGVGLIPDVIPVPFRIRGIALSKLTLSFEPSLIFIGIGALFGMKVGVSLLVGALLNYGVLAPWLIQNKEITHEPPKIVAAAAPQFPLTIEPEQTFTVKLKQAVDRPDFPTENELKADPSLASAISTEEYAYTWKRRTVYSNLRELEKDLNAAKQQDGSPNPLHYAVKVEAEQNRAKQTDFLVVEAPKANALEAGISLPEKQPGGILKALGFALPADATEAEIKAAAAKQTQKAEQDIGGFRNISAWSLWPGATVLVVGGLLMLAFQWRTLGKTFASIFTSLGGKRVGEADPLEHLEIPMTWFLYGSLFTGLCATLLLTWFFHIHWWMGAVAVVLTFFLAAVAARAGAEIGINPIGALGKVTQLTYGALAPGDIPANLMTAGVTAGAACSCSDTVGNLKVGHMVGANPRKQFISQLFGVMAGSLLAVPAYFILVPDVSMLGGERFPAPSALVWMGVAKVLSQGFSTLPKTAVWAIAIAFASGVIIVVVDRLFPKLKPYTPSPTALGIAFTIPASTSIAMFFGALIAWILQKKAAEWNEMYTIPVASGCIAGESIMGVILAALIASGLLNQ